MIALAPVQEPFLFYASTFFDILDLSLHIDSQDFIVHLCNAEHGVRQDSAHIFLSKFQSTNIMGELDVIKNFVKNVVKESVDEAFATVAPKYLDKKEERFYSVEQAQKLLKIGKTALYDRINAGTIRTKKEGGSRLIYADDLDAEIAANRAGRYIHFRKRNR